MFEKFKARWHAAEQDSAEDGTCAVGFHIYKKQLGS